MNTFHEKLPTNALSAAAKRASHGVPFSSSLFFFQCSTDIALSIFAVCNINSELNYLNYLNCLIISHKCWTFPLTSRRSIIITELLETVVQRILLVLLSWTETQSHIWIFERPDWCRKKWPPFTRRHFQMYFFNENVCISIRISLNFLPGGTISNIIVLVQIMDWRRPDDRPLSESIIVNVLTRICVTRPQWVNSLSLHVSNYLAD